MTYSITARDRDTGQMGVAVQSHWFSVGSVVTWGEAGVGVVATQAFAERSYGPLGLELMRGGRSASAALEELLSKDAERSRRQVAMVDAKGDVSAFTGDGCLAEAGHLVGDGFSVQANMMLHATVPDAMGMDPIGLALENFNALGMWRTEEGGVPLQLEGQLVSGETLKGVDDLRKVLVGPRRKDYYRSLTEKLLIFALGRGLEHTDTEFVDAIVERVEKSGGSAMALLIGVIESDAFQRCRPEGT
jgi:hypothetical protein